MRTQRQHAWAQLSENLADQWGRGIRYGDDPEDADLPQYDLAGLRTRREVWRVVLALSDLLDLGEREDMTVEEVIRRGPPEVQRSLATIIELAGMADPTEGGRG